MNHDALPLLLQRADFLSQPDLPARLADIVGKGTLSKFPTSAAPLPPQAFRGQFPKSAQV